MNNYFVIHGSFSNPFANWFPWLYETISEQKNSGKEDSICYVPHFPTGIGFQTYENWERVLLSYVESKKLNEDSIIFAHSIAPIFICKFLIKNKIKVKRLVFVCGFNHYNTPSEEYNIVNKSMFIDNENLVKNYCNDIICFYSNNDPYVNFEDEKKFADTVANKQIIMENGGHLNKAFGFDKFPQLIDFLG